MDLDLMKQIVKIQEDDKLSPAVKERLIAALMKGTAGPEQAQSAERQIWDKTYGDGGFYLISSALTGMFPPAGIALFAAPAIGAGVIKSAKLAGSAAKGTLNFAASLFGKGPQAMPKIGNKLTELEAAYQKEVIRVKATTKDREQKRALALLEKSYREGRQRLMGG